MNKTQREFAIKIVDLWMATLPRRVPDETVLEQCKIISHRGEHDNRVVFENTLPAYEIARANGVWGIEGDLRWTADLVPIVIHDPDGGRVFANEVVVADVSFYELRQELPLVPSLAELVEEFGGNTHLMLELKAEHFPHLQRQQQILQQHLAGLVPTEDYHLLALDPVLFEAFDVQPRNCCLPVAEENIAAISEATLASDYGGITGHFLLLNNKRKQRHEMAGQLVGTGFIKSRNCLFRELNRRVEWIFSNDAVKLQKIIDKHRLKSKGPKRTAP